MNNQKLNDTQLVLLNAAAQRKDGSLLPLPDSISATPPQVRKCLEALLGRNLIAEHHVKTPAQTWRDVDGERLGLVITDLGQSAIGLGIEGHAGCKQGKGDNPSAATGSPAGSLAGRGAKQAQLIEMLALPGGGSIDEITAATGWLPHSARAMLTGLRKRGFTVTSEKVDGVRRYRASAPAQSR